MLRHEEQRTVKWFLIFFYIILVGYDFFYYYFLPVHVKNEHSGLPSNFWCLNYIVLAILIPIIFYLNKVNKQFWVKYVFFISYLLTAFTVDILSFYGSKITYTSGNVVEVFMVFALPIFLNTRYFWLVSLGVIAKYILTAIILSNSYLILPIIIFTIISIMSFFLLVRFQGYVRAIKISYDNQLEGIVKGVIATLELKDPYTRGHSERVASYALLLAKGIDKFSKEEQKSFYYACLLHDIGKVHIPDQILMKPGKLTIEEFEIIKSHPSVGAEAVKNVEGIKDCICVIRSHHERWDGKGYPDQLKEEKIPLLARVTSIADAFDAMTSSRSYRAAMPVEEAYQRIIDGKGSQFDPMLVEEFKRVFPTWVEFHEKYAWTKEWELPKEVEL
ncbi:HD domain-containing phosphohydrolase [Neobacillus drentensis]|uniref:HD domain-containing phosphohydrolase n=1 Tax=Neobacillus drentensis TaxID=220684 RepID=UPI00285CDC01|nr:HD domain-containing phosphohydrolase [Neobacillus drentensis]MDR7238320.1 putative nucleotidyltransferase with HDIG domain [Neobacillus drentensis]